MNPIQRSSQIHPPIKLNQNVSQPQSKFWFVLGREPLLSAAELFSLLDNESITISSPLAWSEGKLDAAKLMRQLGGVIKIGKELKGDLNWADIKKAVTSDLLKNPGKLIFGLSAYQGLTEQISAAEIKELGYDIKNDLKQQERSARLINKDSLALPAATIAATNLVARGSEYLIWEDPQTKKFALAKTVAIHEFAEWGERDFGRPSRDAKAGMLPPKLARIMLNLANLSLNSNILDPFCGSGTILTEAVLLRYNKITGSDVADVAIQDSQANVAWIKQDKNNEILSAVSLIQTDVRDLSRKISNESIDGIITEPFLGPPLRGQETPGELVANTMALSNLYIEAFQSFTKILKPGAVVIFIFPQFVMKNKIYRTAEAAVSKIKKFGFRPEPLLPATISPEPFVLYRRPHQFVGREIWKFRFTA